LSRIPRTDVRESYCHKPHRIDCEFSCCVQKATDKSTYQAAKGGRGLIGKNQLTGQVSQTSAELQRALRGSTENRAKDARREQWGEEAEDSRRAPGPNTGRRDCGGGTRFM